MLRGLLTEEEWSFFEPFVTATNGRPPSDHRRTLDAVFWIARTGAPWRDLPDTLGNSNSVHRQSRRWTVGGLWDLMLETLADGGGNALVQMVDSTVIRAHHCAAGAKGGLKVRLLAARAAGSRPRSMPGPTLRVLQSLLGPERRKTGWMRAEAAGDLGPWRQQVILGRGSWDADALRDIVRDVALETLADPDGVLVIDETGFLKQGKSSCGVGRQYTGSAGKITNCQIGVFASYVSRHGHAFIDRALYLPKAWTGEPARMEAAHVPARIGFATKPQLAAGMIERAITAGVPFNWVAADTVYGVGDIEMALRRAGKGYVLGTHAIQPYNSWINKPRIAGTAEQIAQDLAPSARQRLSAGDSTKGPRLFDWAYLELADIEGEEYGTNGIWTRGLLIRRSIADGERAFFSTWCPVGTDTGVAVAIEGHRWAIKDSFEAAKNEYGLDHNESRSWHGWHRHVSLVMLAFSMMAIIRHRANLLPASQTARRPSYAVRHSSAGRSRKSAAPPRVWLNAASGRLTS